MMVGFGCGAHCGTNEVHIDHHCYCDQGYIDDDLDAGTGLNCTGEC